MPRPDTFLPVYLRRTSRTAVELLASVETLGDDSPRCGLQAFVADLVDFTITERFEQTFGMTIERFLALHPLRDGDALHLAALRLAGLQFQSEGATQDAQPGKRPAV